MLSEEMEKDDAAAEMPADENVSESDHVDEVDEEEGESSSAGAAGSAARHIDIGNFRVFNDLRLPEYDMGGCKAFVAEGGRRDDSQLFALVGDPAMPSRADVLKFLSGIHIAGQIDLIDYEIAYWPAFDRKTIIYFYEKPGGSRVFVEDMKKPLIDDHDLGQVVVTPVINVLGALADKGMTHRNVRADNLYFSDGTRAGVVLGDCVAMPPAYNQPLVYEPVSRMTAHPAGRGIGSILDDLYALGMTLAALGIGHTPMRNLSDEEIIRLKLSKGSFQALVSHEKLPLTLIEPVRGLLSDDPAERWGISEINAWLDGRRVKPVQASTDRKAARAQNIAGKDYYTVRALANAIANNWATALAPLREGVVEVWLRRGLSDNDRAKAMSDAMRQLSWSTGDKRSAEDVLVSRAIIILDPAGPLRHRGFSSMVDGLGGMLSYDVQHGRGAQQFSEVILRDIPSFWFGRQAGFSTEIQALQKAYKGLRYYLQQQSMGYGYERCLYVLNRNQHCLSPLIETEYVMKISQLLPALEKIASDVQPDMWPVDRHIAAFIACRLEDDTEAQLLALQNPADEVEFSRSIISMLALVQWRHGPDSLPKLSQWVAKLMEPAVKVFHSKTRRERVHKEIPKLAKRGNLVELYNLINDEEERRRDQDEFISAVEEYSAAESEVFDLDASGPARLELAEQVGQQAAAFASTMIALLTVSALFMIYVW